MSVDRCFTIVGDSNIKWNMTPTNCRDRPLMSGAQVLQCGHIGMLSTSFGAVRAESTICIVAVVTELLLATGECGTIFSTIDPILATFAQKLNDFCSSRQGLKVNLTLFSISRSAISL